MNISNMGSYVWASNIETDCSIDGYGPIKSNLGEIILSGKDAAHISCHSLAEQWNYVYVGITEG